MHKQIVCIVLNIFQHGKYLVAYVLKEFFPLEQTKYYYILFSNTVDPEQLVSDEVSDQDPHFPE